MIELRTNQIAYLRQQAHSLKPVVMLGKQGLNQQVLAKIGQELDAHELIKVKFLEYRDQKRELAATIAAEADCTLVAIIGNIAILYRPHPDPARRSIVLPGTAS
jgi:RNA-binding protein